MFFIFRCQCCSSLAAIAAAETGLLHLANVPKRDCYHPSNRSSCARRWTARLRCTAITALSTLCTLLNTNSVLRKHRRRGTLRNIWNTSFTLRKSGKSQVWVEPKETQPRLIWHQTQGLKHWITPLFSFIFGPFHRNENWYHSKTIIVIRQISFG